MGIQGRKEECMYPAFVQVLAMAPGLNQLEIIPFRVAAYDVKVTFTELYNL